MYERSMDEAEVEATKESLCLSLSLSLSLSLGWSSSLSVVDRKLAYPLLQSPLFCVCGSPTPSRLRVNAVSLTRLCRRAVTYRREGGANAKRACQRSTQARSTLELSQLGHGQKYDLVEYTV